MKKCPHCNIANSDDRINCVVCGKDISGVEKGSYVKQKYIIQYDGSTKSPLAKVDDDILIPKNRVTAGLFAILLGGLGVHKFYLGENGKGLLYILFSWTGIPTLISIIEGIIILTQSDEEFKKQHNLKLVSCTNNRQKEITFSKADELMKFKKLYDDGVIDKYEFDKKKKELL